MVYHYIIVSNDKSPYSLAMVIEQEIPVLELQKFLTVGDVRAESIQGEGGRLTH
jgi:hypothetical protein